MARVRQRFGWRELSIDHQGLRGLAAVGDDAADFNYQRVGIDSQDMDGADRSGNTFTGICAVNRETGQSVQSRVVGQGGRILRGDDQAGAGGSENTDVARVWR
jgi:hypothetical protein